MNALIFGGMAFVVIYGGFTIASSWGMPTMDKMIEMSRPRHPDTK